MTSTIVALVLHPQLASEVLQGLDPKAHRGGLLDLRAVSAEVKDQVDGFIVEVVTEATFFAGSKIAERRVPYFSEGLVKPFCCVCLVRPKKRGDECPNAFSMATPAARERFEGEIDRRLTRQVKYIGSKPFFGRDSHKNFEKIKTTTNFVQQLPPLPSVLSMLTVDQLPALDSLTLRANHFQDQGQTHAWIQSTSSRALMQQVSYLMFHPQEYKEKNQSTGLTPPATTNDRVIDHTGGGYEMGGEEVRTLLEGFKGGNLKQLVLNDVRHNAIAAVVKAAEQLAPQLEGFCLCNNFYDEVKPKGVGLASNEVAVAKFLSKAASLKDLTLYMGHYKAEPTFDQISRTIAECCPNLTRILLPCWTLTGVQAVVASRGKQLQSLTGSYLWGTGPEIVLAGANVIAANCPLLEAALPLDMSGGSRKECLFEDYYATVTALITGCPKLLTLTWRAEALEHFTQVVQLCPSLTTVSVQFEKPNVFPQECATFASQVATYCSRMESVEIKFAHTFQSRRGKMSGDEDADIALSDEFFAVLVAKGVMFDKLETLRLTAIGGISMEAVLTFVRRCCPAMAALHISKPFRSNGDDPRTSKIVLALSSHKYFVSLRQEKGHECLPDGDTNPKFRSLFYPDQDLALKEVGGVEIRTFAATLKERHLQRVTRSS